MVSGDFDGVVIGGGFFGASIAIELARRGDRMLLVESAPDLCQAASYVNQARVHNGYHYPRSILTALRSRVNYPRFLRDYAECVVGGFRHYYAVPRQHSKVTAAQFAEFVRRIGAPIKPAPDAVRRWFEPDLVEDVFAVEEVAFDAVILKNLVRRWLDESGVTVALSTTARKVQCERADAKPPMLVDLVDATGESRVRARRFVFNCTYSRINRLLFESGLTPIPLRHELAELALVEPPEEFREAAITVMCGPFFSTMPFPARGLHSFSHVRYTPNCSWEDGRDGKRAPVDGARDLVRKSRFVHMQKDAQRYVPMLGRCRYVESLWEMKTVLPQSESNDSRPILFRRDPTVPSFVSVMGGKVDNVYDLPRELDELCVPAGPSEAA